MKTVFEEISPDTDSSIRLMVNPNLSDFFFWHFHPEYEIVFIEGSGGNRHVGNHSSRFEGSDLVLIGSYIPHLNFDYGIKGPYEKMVVQFNPQFLQQAERSIPEFGTIRDLLTLSSHGVAFGERSKRAIGPRLKALPTLDAFDRLLELLNILHALMLAEDKELLHDQPVKNHYTVKDQDRLKRIYKYIDEHYQEPIGLSSVAKLCHLSEGGFSRYFKKMTRLTFTEFVNSYRIDKAKKLLLLDKNVTEVCFECGFESLSYFNRTFKKITGTNPLSFKKEYLSHQ